MATKDNKRPHVSTGDTPHKEKQTRLVPPNEHGYSRRSLFPVGSSNDKVRESPSASTSFEAKRKVRQGAWSKQEDIALVRFIALHKDLQETESEWPSLRKQHPYWENAACFVKETCGESERTAHAVRSRVVNVLQKKGTLEAVEQEYGIDYECETSLNSDSTPSTSTDAPRVEDNTVDSILYRCSKLLEKSGARALIILIKMILLLLGTDEIVDVLDNMFLDIAERKGIISHPSKFITPSLVAMENLQQNKKSNLLFKFAQCVGKQRPDGSGTLMQMNRMPFGLLQYQIEFFTCKNSQQITMPRGYALWHSTMVSELGHRFNHLFRGPMWSGIAADGIKDPMCARVNVACVSIASVCKSINTSEYHDKPDIQGETIRRLVLSHKDARFWIKADATDVKGALLESARGEWNGDVDLGDGKLGQLKDEYSVRKGEITDCLKVHSSPNKTSSLLQGIQLGLIEDKGFLEAGLSTSLKEYQEKYDKVGSPEERLKELNWEVVEFTCSKLLENCQRLHNIIQNLSTFLSPYTFCFKSFIFQFKHIHPEFLTYLRDLFKKKRQPPATHVLVTMVSDERRNMKPYAVSVQYVPYTSLADKSLRVLVNKVKMAMTEQNLKVVGTVTDGEFSSLRTQGETRPLHIWQLIHDARKSVKQLSKKSLLRMLEYIKDTNGEVTAVHPHPAIPREVVESICLRQSNGLDLIEAVENIRHMLVPVGHTPHTFRRNIPKSFLDCLRSLIGTLFFQQAVAAWKEKGIDFSTHLYVLEIDPITGIIHHEREDHCHILKRIAKHTREGAYLKLNLDAFDEAMRDPKTGLTHTALVGKRKQSVTDVEKLLSFHVAKFLDEKGHKTEAKYVKIVARWHEASDGRGVSQLNRCKANYEMLNYLMDELVPWHNTDYDLSSIDINRPFQGIRGFSPETLIAITTNIESQEYRRCENATIGWEEHPRASTTDDVECFFSLCHQKLGCTFTLKEFKYHWRKICREFTMKIDDDLPFYYWTLNERFRGTDETYESFDESPPVASNIQPEQHSLRLHKLKINRREDPSIFTAGRSFLPIRDKGSIRQRMHRDPVNLPFTVAPQ